MKPTLTWLGGLSNLEVSTQCINKKSLSERCCYVRSEQTDLLYANAKGLIQIWRIEIRAASLSLVSFRPVGFGSRPTYILYQYISSFRGPSIYHIVFSRVCGGWSFPLWRWNLTFSDTEMKELGTRTQIVIHNTRSLIRTSQVCLRHLAVGRSLHGGRI